MSTELYTSLQRLTIEALDCVIKPPNYDSQGHLHIFRWFKFTLKPPYSIARGKLRLAIWDTSFWTFWLKFGHKGP